MWEIVCDVDRDPEYWNGLNSVHNIRRQGNNIERRVVVGFIGHGGLQKIRLNPEGKSVELTMTRGPLKGTREILLTPSKNGGATRVAVSWDFVFSRVPNFAHAFVQAQLESGTREALKKIAEAAARGPRMGNPREARKQPDKGAVQKREGRLGFA